MKKLEDGTLQFSIFPTIIHVLDFSDLVGDVEKICNGVEWSKLGGENQSADLQILESHPEIKEKFTNKVNQTLVSQFKYVNPFQIITSWFTRTKPEANIQKHNHTNSIWSSVYYFHDDCNPLTFHKDFPLINVPMDGDDPDLMMHGDVTFPAISGKMLLFPSYLDHSVVENMTGKYRYSLAMNWMPHGICQIGDSGYNYQ